MWVHEVERAERTQLTFLILEQNGGKENFAEMLGD
jgi:hypothetical protein